jgi:ABC-type nickel/cobalt efflux system permease component RcnA
MSSLVALVKAEPVRFIAAIQATLALAVLFGVALTAVQIAGIVLAIAAWLSFVTRSQVTPV